MPYAAEISRINPSCFLFLLDQSGSMQEVVPMNGRTKAQNAADILNRLLSNLVLRCAKPEVRDYFHIGVVGYGGDNTATRVGPALGGSLAGRELVPISEIANSPVRIEERVKKTEDGAGGLVDQKIKFPVWFDAVADGGTPMSQALTKAYEILSPWVISHPTSFPPAVMNITDGESTDGNPTSASDLLKSLVTNDGNVLLLTVYLSSSQAAPIEFPDESVLLPDANAQLLFSLSSRLSPQMQQAARQEGLKVSDSTRGFVYNADPVALIRFLEIGTRASNLR